MGRELLSLKQPHWIQSIGQPWHPRDQGHTSDAQSRRSHPAFYPGATSSVPTHNVHRVLPAFLTNVRTQMPSRRGMGT